MTTRWPGKAFESVGRSLGGLRLDLSLAFRNVVRHGRRSIVGLGAVAAGVIAMLLASGFFEWNYENMRERTIRSRIGHIQVTARGYADSGMADPFAYLITEKLSALTAIESFPEVQLAAPRLFFNGLISAGESTVSFVAEGVDPSKERALQGALIIRSGEDLDRIDEQALIIGRGLAESLGVREGQRVTLLATTASGGVNAVELTVKGTFETATKAYDDYAIRVPLDVAQKLLRVAGVHGWLVLLHNTEQTDLVTGKLRGDPRLARLDVTPWHDVPVADFYHKTVSLFSKQVLVVKVMIAVIIVLSIANTMMNNVRERVGEIGTCMALGDRRATILRRFLMEGGILGFLGGMAGLIAGFALAQLISWIGIPMPPPPGMASGFESGILVTPHLLVEALALSVLTAFVAGVYPARKAARMVVHEVLRQAR